MRYGGWYARRRGILEHLDKGKISLVDSAIHDFLCLLCDYNTGVAWASAVKIHALCPRGVSKDAVKRSLVHLRSIGWIRHWYKKGQKGNYPILVARWLVTDSNGKKWLTNAKRTVDWRHPQFDPVSEEPDEGSGEGSAPAPEPDDGFDAFWKAYPRRTAKIAARKAWAKIAGINGHAAEIVLAVQKYKASGQWDDKQFVPHPARFLKERRWEDEITPRTKANGKPESEIQRMIRRAEAKRQP